MITVLDTYEDIQWLLTTHVNKRQVISQCNLSKYWEVLFAVIEGNEDCPSRIELFSMREPKYNSAKVVGVLNKEGAGYVWSKVRTAKRIG